MERRGKYSILFFILCLLSAANTWSKPDPPPELLTIIAEFSELEGNFESGDWNNAMSSLEEIEKFFKNIELHNADIFKKNNYNTVVKKLKMSIGNKDFKTTEDSYISLQKMFFLLTENYHYEIPPILQVMDKYINKEGVEALENKDFDEVYNEMREVGTFFRLSQDTLKKKGASEELLRGFNKKLIQVIKECKMEDKSKVTLYYNDLQKLFDSFLGLYTDQPTPQ